MRGMRVRQDAIVSSTGCRDFWGQNVEAAPLPIHAQFVTAIITPYRATDYILGIDSLTAYR
jgi:hypothetical protein